MWRKRNITLKNLYLILFGLFISISHFPLFCQPLLFLFVSIFCWMLLLLLWLLFLFDDAMTPLLSVTFCILAFSFSNAIIFSNVITKPITTSRLQCNIYYLYYNMCSNAIYSKSICVIRTNIYIHLHSKEKI